MAGYLLANMLVERKTVVGIEDTGYPDARNNFYDALTMSRLCRLIWMV